MVYIDMTAAVQYVKTLRPSWSDAECGQFLEKCRTTLNSSLSQYGRELLENCIALEEIDRGALR